MLEKLKNIIKNNLTNTNLNLQGIKNIDILSITCFWNICNFSAIIKYHGIKFYCYYNNTIKDVIIERY